MSVCVHWRLPPTGSFSKASMKSLGKPGFNRNRLPNLSEVLNELTLEPVDLRSFLEFMQNQQRSGDYLDFLLDICQHTSLCRHYISKPNRSALVRAPELETYLCKVWSDVLDDLKDSPSTSKYLARNKNIGSSKIVDAANHTPYLHLDDENMASSSFHSLGSLQFVLQGSRDQLANREFDLQSQSSIRIDNLRTRSLSFARTISRSDIRASAENIVYTFLLNGAEREISIPSNITSRIVKSIEEGLHDPDIFEAAKIYAFEAIERHAFPNFLHYKGLGNLVQSSRMSRLFIGLLAMFGGFWAGFAFILLNTPIKSRNWLILPFLVGTYSLCSHLYGVDPFLALAGLSEHSFAKYTRIREQYVRQLMKKRGFMVLLSTLLSGCSFIVLFLFIPGKRI